MTTIHASRVPRLLACPASGRCPDAIGGEDAALGKVVHAALAQAVRTGKMPEGLPDAARVLVWRGMKIYEEAKASERA